MERANSYKKTEIGVIPEDWEVKRLGELCTIKRGASPRPIRRYLTDDPNGIHWIRIGDADKTGIIKDTEQKVINEGKDKSVFVNKGDLLLSNSMSYGKPYMLEIDGCIHDGWLSIQEKHGNLNKRYLYYSFASDKSKTFFSLMSAGSGVQNLNKEAVSKLPIPLPPLQEQKAIAKVLSDVDELITSIEELIDKKQKIKQGTMQLLLTGKKRLPGFTGEWERVKIKDLLYYERPEKYIESEIDESKYGLIPVLTANKAFILGTTNNKLNCYTDLPVIIFDDFTVESKYVDFVFKVRSSAIKILKPRRNVDVKFVYYLMQIISFSVGDHKRHYISQYQEINVTVPSFPEQKAIAQILSDMDLEIEALEEKLEKYKLIKDGMMEQLLTGKVRLI